jgi:biopolymer transport protein ExbD
MRRAIVILAIVAFTAGCQKKGQTKREAMALLCGIGSQPPPDLSHLNPSERQAALAKWLTEQIKNDYAKGLLAALASAPPGERAPRIRAAAAEAGIEDCKPVFGATATVIAGIEVTDVDDLATGTDMLDQEAPVVAMSATALLVEGKPIVSITNGTIDRALRDPNDPRIISKLLEVLAALAKAQGIETVTIAADPATPYALVADAITVARSVGAKHFVLAGVADGELRSIPIELPVTMLPPGDLGIVVAVSRAELAITSISGHVGTLANPKLRVAMTPRIERMAALRKALAEVHRGVPPEASRRVLLTIDTALEVRDVTEIAAAIRAGENGVLFPDVIVMTAADGTPGLAAGTPIATHGDGDGSGSGAGSGSDAPAIPPPAITMLDVAMAKDPGDVIPDANMIVDKINQAYVENLRLCFVEAVKENPRAAVAVELLFTVDPEGRIVATGTVGEYGALGQCLQDRAKNWRFSKARDGVTHKPMQIRYAVRLTPKVAS